MIPEMLETPRLRLRRLWQDDLPDWRGMHRDPRVMATLGGVWSDERSAAALDRMLADWAERGVGWWRIELRETGDFAGRGGLRYVEVEGTEEVEVGYALRPDHWGRGLATEVAVAAVQVAFRHLDRPDVVSFSREANHASRRVMEKAGLRFERQFVRHGEPHVLYRLRREAWAGPGGP